MEIERFIESLISLRIILKKIEKTNFIEKLKIIKMETITEKELKETKIRKIDELEELERSFNF